MPIPLLAGLCRRELPVELTRPSDVEVARVLHLAGHITCDLPAPTKGLNDQRRDSIRVISVTATGREMALSFGGKAKKSKRRSPARAGAHLPLVLHHDQKGWRFRLRELWLRLRHRI